MRFRDFKIRRVIEKQRYNTRRLHEVSWKSPALNIEQPGRPIS